MRNRLVVLIALALVAGGSVAAGKVYRWIDEQGRVHYTDMPVRNSQEVNVRLGTPVGHDADAAAQDEAQAAAKAEECTAKKGQYESYKGAVRLVERDSTGHEHEYTPEEREKLLAMTQSEITRLCGEQPQG